MKNFLFFLLSILFLASCSNNTVDIDAINKPEIQTIDFDKKADEFSKSGDQKNLFILSEQYCQKDLPQACYLLGTFQAKGEQTQKNMDAAKENFAKACNSNFAKACNSLGLIYKLKGDTKKAEKYFQKASYLGDNLGNYSLGLLYENSNKQLALTNFQKSCELNHAHSCVKFAQMLREQESDKDTNSTLVYDLKGCDLKDSQGCFNAGVTNYKNKQYEDAISNFKSGCELGSYPSCERAVDLINKDQILSKEQKDDLLKDLNETITNNQMKVDNEKN